MVTIENWEEYAILRADGELDAAEAAALESFLAAHPELREEAKLFESLKLVPDEAVVFGGKEALLKPEPKVIALNTRWIVAAAAGVALLLGATLLLRNGEEGAAASGGAVAGAVKLEAPKPPVRQAPVVAPSANEQLQNILEEREPVYASQPSAPVQKETPQEAPRLSQPEPAPESLDLAALPANESSVLPVAVEMQEAQPKTIPSQPAISPSENKKETKRSLERFAISEDHLRLAAELKSVASNRLQALRNTREKLRNADVTVQFANRNLFTIHF